MWVSCGEQYFPIYQMKPSQEDWQKLVFKEEKLFCSREIEFFIIILLVVMIVVIDSCVTFLIVVNLLIIIVQVINKDKINKCCVKETIFNYKVL